MSVTIAAGELQATFLPDAGMLGTSLRFAGQELVDFSGGLARYRDGQLTGLPLLAPWANRLDRLRYRAAGVDVDLEGLALSTDENGLPIHGTMTAAEGWEVVERAAAGLRARFRYGDKPDLLAAFPFPHLLEIDVHVDGRELRIETTLRPTTNRPVPVAFGWHPYLRLPNGDRSSWRLRLPAREHLELDGRGIPTGASKPEAAESAPIGERTFDDLYALKHDRVLGLLSPNRDVTVRCEAGYRFAQVYVPPGAEFVCLEPMTAPTNALADGSCALAAPGDSYTATFSIEVA